MPASNERAATLYDVARLAGVSKSTASRVLNGDARVSPEAVALVHRSAAALNYVRNPAALAMSTSNGTRVVIGVVTPGTAIVVDEYLARVVATAATLCSAERIGVAVQALPLNGRDPFGLLANDPTVHGLILTNTTDAVLRAIPRRLAGRVVSIGIGSLRVPSIDVDNYTAAAVITRHLIESGRRRIAMIAGPSWLPCTNRLTQSYKQSMLDAGLRPRAIVADFTTASGFAATTKVLRRWPDTDAIFAVCDATAIGVLEALRAQHIDVPHDVAVAGFGDIPFAGSTQLTTATHPVEAIAAAATRTVLSAVATRRSDITFGSELVLRQTA